MKHTLQNEYEVTEDGRVFSISHNWRGYGRRELIQYKDPDGYPCVRLTMGGKRKRYPVHGLVASIFLGEKPSRFHQVRHLNGNKTDNRVTNLAWGTAKENALDRNKHGRTSCGVSHSKSIKESNHIQMVARGKEHYKAKRRIENV